MQRLEYLLIRLIKNGKASLRGSSKTILVGDMPQTVTRVFSNCNIARKNKSLFKSSLGVKFVINSLLAVLTAASARPLDGGKYLIISDHGLPNYEKVFSRKGSEL